MPVSSHQADHSAASQEAARLKTRQRINPFAQYLLMLAAMISAYSLYAMYMVPILEGPPSQIRKRIVARTKTEPRQQDKSWLQPLLPKDAWELENCKTLIISQGTILFQDYQPLDDGYVDVFPFTLIMNAAPGDAGTTIVREQSDKPPLVLRCLQGSKLKFNRPLTIGVGGGDLQMESARLLGQVSVLRPESAYGKNDHIAVWTSNVQIDRQQIFSLDDVRFQFGPNKGRGRHLRIMLDHLDQQNKFGNRFANVSGVRRLELASLQQLRLEPSRKTPTRTTATELQSPDTGNPAAADDFFSGQKAPLEVSCEGEFVFDFETKTASFHDKVFVQQLDQQRDSLNCDVLSLKFAERMTAQPVASVNTTAGSPTESNQPDNTKSGDAPNLELISFAAEGSPVQIVSRTRETKITADRVDYEVGTRRIEANSRSQVTIINPDYQLTAQQLKYTLPPDQSPGPLDAEGPGKLLRHATADQEEFYLQWQGPLKLRMEDGQQVVSISGGADVRLGTETSIAAKQLKLWAWQSRTANTSTEQRKWTWQPARLETFGSVKIASPEISGTTEKLVATWTLPGDSTATASPTVRAMYRPADDRLSGSENFAVTQRQRIQPRAQPRNQQSEPNSGWIAPVSYNAPAKVAFTRKLKFRGDQIDIALAQVEEVSQISQLEIVGNVEVFEATSQPGAQPLKITGQRLKIVPTAAETYRLSVSGRGRSGARVVAEGLQLSGESIFLDQAANKIWVDGPGNLILQPTTEEQSKIQSSVSPPKSKSDAIQVGWSAGMIFDGKKIYFEKDVAMNAATTAKNGTPSQSRSFSQGLSIALKNAIDFSKLSQQSNQPKVEVLKMVLVDQLVPEKRVFKLASHQTGNQESTAENIKTPIVIQNQTLDTQGQRVEQQKIIVPQATFDVQTGAISAKGPGSIQIHRKGRSGVMTPPGSPQSRQTKSSNPNELTYIQINFDGTLVANTEQREMQIAGRVRSLTAPVKSWDQTVNPDLDPSQWPREAVRLVCDRVQMAQWSPSAAAKPNNEMIATGNAHIVSQTFEATADRVSYNQANDMLVVEGTTRSDANLWFRQSPQASPDHLVAGKILYRLSDQWTEVQGVRNVNVKSK